MERPVFKESEIIIPRIPEEIKGTQYYFKNFSVFIGKIPMDKIKELKKRWLICKTDKEDVWIATEKENEINMNEKQDNILDNYITEDIDYTGCHPVIAQALRQGRGIECEVWDGPENKKIRTVMSYVSNAKYPYRINSNSPPDSVYLNAEPIKKKKMYVRSKDYILGWLKGKGYKENYEGSYWKGEALAWRKEMFDYCGKEKPDDYNWLPDWLEERDDKD